LSTNDGTILLQGLSFWVLISLEAVVSLQRSLRQFWAAEQAQDLVEYSMILAVVVLAVVGVSGILARPMNSIWTVTNENLSSALSVANH